MVALTQVCHHRNNILSNAVLKICKRNLSLNFCGITNTHGISQLVRWRRSSYCLYSHGDVDIVPVSRHIIDFAFEERLLKLCFFYFRHFIFIFSLVFKSKFRFRYVHGCIIIPTHIKKNILTISNFKFFQCGNFSIHYFEDNVMCKLETKQIICLHKEH